LLFPTHFRQAFPLMMMAHDSSSGPVALAEETIAAVRSAIAEYVRAPEHGDGLGAALRAMAAEARDRSMLPEQLLVVLKDIWYSLPSVRNMSDMSEQVRLLQRVVTMCIKEYYITPTEGAKRRPQER
jgi:hypothetical protein